MAFFYGQVALVNRELLLGLLVDVGDFFHSERVLRPEASDDSILGALTLDKSLNATQVSLLLKSNETPYINFIICNSIPKTHVSNIPVLKDMSLSISTLMQTYWISKQWLSLSQEWSFPCSCLQRSHSNHHLLQQTLASICSHQLLITDAHHFHHSIGRPLLWVSLLLCSGWAAQW